MSEKFKIIVFDDSDTDRKLLERLLEKNEFSVIVHASGKSALKVIEKESPAIVLLDVSMPEVDGNEVLRHIREKYSAIELPVIMVTAKSESEDIIESLKIGANDYVTKPIAFDVILMRIRTQLKIVELSKKMSQLKEMATINAMVATYNHEINNPLASATLLLQNVKAKIDEEEFKKLEAALWKIADIIKKIKDVSQNSSAEYLSYLQSSKILDLKKKK